MTGQSFANGLTMRATLLSEFPVSLFSRMSWNMDKDAEYSTLSPLAKDCPVINSKFCYIKDR